MHSRHSLNQAKLCQIKQYLSTFNAYNLHQFKYSLRQHKRIRHYWIQHHHDTSWRGGRGRSELVSFETWQVTNKDSPTGGEEEGGAGWGASKHGMSQRRTHSLEGRKGEERVGELRNVAGHKRGLTNWRGGRERSGL